MSYHDGEFDKLYAHIGEVDGDGTYWPDPHFDTQHHVVRAIRDARKFTAVLNRRLTTVEGAPWQASAPPS